MYVRSYTLRPPKIKMKTKMGEEGKTREEKAERLKTLAERKYKQSKVKSALKYARRAHRLYPDLDGFSEMLTVFKILNVYSKSSSNEHPPPDWYEILQIEPFSHINSIKKQYKKLALVLHPDKNTCIGSEEAFKCVSEAFRVLSDKIRRKEYDLKLRIALQAQATEEGIGSPLPSGRVVETFWTACSTCKLFHQFESKYVGKRLVCPGCKKIFLAVQVAVGEEFDDDDGVGVGVGVEQGGDGEESDDGVGEFYNGLRGKRRIEEFDDGVRRMRRIEDLENSVRGKRRIEELCIRVRGRKSVVDESDNGAKGKRGGSQGLDYGVRGKRKVEEVNDVVREKKKTVVDTPERVPRFNLRSLSKTVKGREEMTLAEMQLEAKQKLLEEKRKMKAVQVQKMKEKEKEKTREKEERRREREKERKREESGHMLSRESSEVEVEVMDVEDPDFYDFDKDRSERCFKRSQIWAIYDDDDGMPRHYGLIDEVVSMNPFEVKMSWLDMESNGDERLICWERSGFHISCGRFKVSRKTVVDSVNIFSHLVECERVAREVYRVYPRKGSIWALYNERALEEDNENSSLGDRRCYDIVVSLTTYSEMHGLSMAYLEKVEGFKTVFKRQEIGCNAVKWLEKDDFRLFSHQIPAKKLSGAEAPDLPMDCWELDPASLPPDLLSITQGE